MANSGIEVSAEVEDAFAKMKLHNKGCQLLVMKIDKQENSKYESINVRECKDECDNDGLVFYVKNELKLTPAFIIHDHHVGNTKKLVFITWLPDGLTAKEKMPYSTSMNGIRPKFDGVKFHQANDYDDIELDCIKCSISQ